MKKKILSLALILVMVFALVRAVAAAPVSLPSTVQPGRFLAAIEPPASDSIPISNRTELAAMSKDLSGKYHLTADIDLSDGAWVPIGYDNSYYSRTSTKFEGIFDGQGHIIRNLAVVNINVYKPMGWSVYSYTGLFGCASSTAIIKNVGLIGANINIDIDINNRDDIVLTTSLGSVIYSGGICGYGGNISNCFTTGTVSSITTSNYRSTVYAGGISGVYGNISNCYNTASVSVTSDGIYAEAYAGGLCGYNFAGFSVANCFTASLCYALKGLEKEAY
ncbi:MAG: hypothetical protein LBH95_03525 [Oscillospiraceae bacterium]|nr:hypothetical protein [Oscillospiraceae bacterium]